MNDLTDEQWAQMAADTAATWEQGLGHVWLRGVRVFFEPFNICSPIPPEHIGGVLEGG